jgi:hypothetical protein
MSVVNYIKEDLLFKCDFLDDAYRYVAVDKCRKVCVYTSKPMWTPRCCAWRGQSRYFIGYLHTSIVFEPEETLFRLEKANVNLEKA